MAFTGSSGIYLDSPQFFLNYSFILTSALFSSFPTFPCSLLYLLSSWCCAKTHKLVLQDLREKTNPIGHQIDSSECDDNYLSLQLYIEILFFPFKLKTLSPKCEGRRYSWHFPSLFFKDQQSQLKNTQHGLRDQRLEPLMGVDQPGINYSVNWKTFWAPLSSVLICLESLLKMVQLREMS